MTRLALLGLFVMTAAGCDCRGDRIRAIEDEDAGVDAGVVSQGDDAGVDAGFDAGQPMACATGRITGRVCAPDQMTWLNGASVKVTGTDCNGNSFEVSATSADDGSFTLEQVPAGNFTVAARLGAFAQDFAVTVTANQTTAIPDNRLCIEQKTAKIAVVTGQGDKIEDLIAGLGLQADKYFGDTANWAASAAPFLSDLNKMKTYDLIFIDCAAAKKAGANTIDLGPNGAQIASNLAAYVQAGGSIYSSDWAMVFPAVAFPGRVTWSLNTANSVSNPFNANQLMGYAPQTLTATVTDAQLAGFLGKTTMPVTFPSAAGGHWGLITSASNATVLLRANGVLACTKSNLACSMSGATLQNIPLAVRFKVTPAGTKGGNVVYTAFHNAGQTTDDVSKVLRFLILNL